MIELIWFKIYLSESHFDNKEWKFSYLYKKTKGDCIFICNGILVKFENTL